MTKKGLLAAVLAALVMGGVFAQENSRHIKPTFGMGFFSGSFGGSSETLLANFIDVDFVNSFGLTLGLQSAMAWNDNIAEMHTFFGVGFTHVAPQWSAGLKLMSAAMINTGGLGIDANGTWWFMDNLGLTAAMSYYFNIGGISWNIFGLRLGISTRF